VRFEPVAWFTFVAVWLLLHPFAPAAGAEDLPSATGTAAVSAGDESATTPGSRREPLKRPPKRSTLAEAAGALQQARAEDNPPSSAEARLREYEIRLAAHSRELMQREAALEAARRRINELTHAPATKTSNRVAEKDPLPAPEALSANPPAPPPQPSTSQPEEAQEQRDLVSSLRQALDAERENRMTLEEEIQRLISDSRSPGQVDTMARSLEGARAVILVLNQRLADEQKARETLEVAIERVRRSAGLSPGQDWVDRFENTMKERREQAERLQHELRDANEAIVALRGKLEAARPDATIDPAALQDLETENRRLRQALDGAQQTNSDLRTQAELASRLAELLYGQPQ
jgi:chromosome segregation ATPase